MRIYVDAGASGSTAEGRPEFRAMLKYLQENPGANLVVLRHDRLFRDMHSEFARLKAKLNPENSVPCRSDINRQNAFCEKKQSSFPKSGAWTSTGEVIEHGVSTGIERVGNKERRSCMKDEDWTLAGWPAIPAFLVLAVAPVFTALVISLPAAWLVNHIFAPNVLLFLFGVERFNYWRVVGLFALLFATQFKIKIHGSSK